MNRAKAYSYLGAMLGAGAVFGICFAPVSWILAAMEEVASYPGEATMEDGIKSLIFILFILFSTMGVPTIASFVLGGEATWGAFFLISLFCLVAGVNVGSASGFTGIAPLIITIPFAALGGFYVYRIVNEHEQKRGAYKRKIEEYRGKLQQWKAEGYEVEELKRKWGFK